MEAMDLTIISKFKDQMGVAFGQIAASSKVIKEMSGEIKTEY